MITTNFRGFYKRIRFEGLSLTGHKKWRGPRIDITRICALRTALSARVTRQSLPPPPPCGGPVRPRPLSMRRTPCSRLLSSCWLPAAARCCPAGLGWAGITGPGPGWLGLAWPPAGSVDRTCGRRRVRNTKQLNFSNSKVIIHYWPLILYD